MTLRWYDAYNRTKHSAEAHFVAATLEYAAAATAAVFVMLLAQYGPQQVRDRVVTRVFAIDRVAEWHPVEMYYGPLPRIPWREVQYAFVTG